MRKAQVGGRLLVFIDISKLHESWQNNIMRYTIGRMKMVLNKNYNFDYLISREWVQRESWFGNFSKRFRETHATT